MGQTMMGLVTLLLWLGFAGTIGASSSNEVSPSVIVLTGILKSRTEWGPPGWGETTKLDSKFAIFVLQLREPRTTRQLYLPDDGKDGEKRFAEIQLWCDNTAFPQCEAALKKSLGHRITVSGQAAYAIEPADYLPVTLRVRLIKRQ
jgi:hypothetical protein